MKNPCFALVNWPTGRYLRPAVKSSFRPFRRTPAGDFKRVWDGVDLLLFGLPGDQT